MEIPDLGTTSELLNNIFARANDAAMAHEDAVLQCQEHQLENTADGDSMLMAPRGNFSEEKMIEGVAELVHGASKVAESVSTKTNGDTEQVAAEEPAVAVHAHIDRGILNEFQQNHFILGGTFPMEFPLGVPGYICSRAPP